MQQLRIMKPQMHADGRRWSERNDWPVAGFDGLVLHSSNTAPGVWLKPDGAFL